MGGVGIGGVGGWSLFRGLVVVCLFVLAISCLLWKGKVIKTK